MLMSDGASRAASVQSPRVSESPGLWQKVQVFWAKKPKEDPDFQILIRLLLLFFKLTVWFTVSEFEDPIKL